MAVTPDGRSFAIAAYPAGSIPSLKTPGPAATVATSRLDMPTPLGFMSVLINRLVYRGSWTVRVGPWRGQRGRRWKVRVATEQDSDRHAAALFDLVNSGQWDPSTEPPPPPAQAQ